jgi:hypothetical protein
MFIINNASKEVDYYSVISKKEASKFSHSSALYISNKKWYIADSK